MNHFYAHPLPGYEAVTQPVNSFVMGYYVCDSQPNSNDAPEGAAIEGFTLLKPLNNSTHTFSRYSYKIDAKTHDTNR